MVDRFMAKTTRFLFGRCQTLGVGFTLTVADKCWLVQPEWLRSDEEQGIGRIWRTGLAQKAPKTRSYRCILKDFDPEKIIVARHDARGLVTGSVYGTAQGGAGAEEDPDRMAID
jgi:hypothetical protein